ncbi:MAG: PadR family transcriptional regulator [Planctomycetota bacterium]|nr:MAG: PadR family transcriptional regulator [Planctomycetota bacterium]
MSLSKELVAASATPIILSILAENENYGYSIIRKVDELSGGEMQWSDGMLYPVLHRLEKQGLIKSKWGKSETGRRRKYYKLEIKGKKTLVEEKRKWNVINTTLESLWKQTKPLI